MRSHPVLPALALTALLLTSCGASGSSEGGTDPGPTTTVTTVTDPTDPEGGDPEVPEDPDQALADAVDATLAARSFTIESQAILEVGPQELGFGAEGSVDYADPLIADLSLFVSQSGDESSVSIKTDGDKVWVSAEGAQVPEFPEGATWVEGDADILATADTLEPIGVLGVVVALRAADGAEASEGEEIDGVPTVRYELEVDYADTVEAAGDDLDGYESSLSLTSEEEIPLVIEAWVGDDGVIRRLRLEILAPANGLGPTGTYDLDLTDVGAEVDPPEAPDADDTLVGPEADDLLDQLITS